MPKQNRVNPFGELVVTAARGRWMGNRGCLHDMNGKLTDKRWTRKPWVTCELQFRERRRQIMTPGQYTELFFLDEATAFAAGHRPCAECRRTSYDRFKSAWIAANHARVPGTTIKEIDDILHCERVDRHTRLQLTWESTLSDLPEGTLVQLSASNDAWLLWGGRLWKWGADGYSTTRTIPSSSRVTVLTPESICLTFMSGYRPQVHLSAAGGMA
jgi:hypothetical protein